MNYLNDGGNFYIESVNIGYDYYSYEFFDYLGLMYINDGTEQEVVRLKGGYNCCTTDLIYDYLGGYSPHYSIDQLESNGSELFFSSEDGFGRMFVKETDDYKVVSSSVLLGAMANGDSLNLRPYFISELVNYFLGYNPQVSIPERVNEQINISSYPNPFVQNTRIDFTLKNDERVRIEIIDISGKIIRHLADEEFETGKHAIVWDATNDSHEKVRSGYYLCKISVGKKTLTEKLILMQ
jgi:hypothetical protein